MEEPLHIFSLLGVGGLRMQKELFIMRRERDRGDLDIGVSALRAVTITDRTSVINHGTAPSTR